jgi:hypothetical protein
MAEEIRSCLKLALAIPVGVLFWGGCHRDAHLADQQLRHPEVKTVTHYGLTLDQDATPKQVAYVLLRAIRDDSLAKTKEDRERALDIQFDLCAATEIANANPTSLTRDELIFEIVHHWTPTLSHYVDDFETEWEKAKARFAVSHTKSRNEAESGPDECKVLMQLNDPSGDPNARVVIVIWLVRDEGYWRVLRPGFDPYHRSIKRRTEVAGDAPQGVSTSGD